MPRTAARGQGDPLVRYRCAHHRSCRQLQQTDTAPHSEGPGQRCPTAPAAVPTQHSGPPLQGCFGKGDSFSRTPSCPAPRLAPGQSSRSVRLQRFSSFVCAEAAAQVVPTARTRRRRDRLSALVGCRQLRAAPAARSCQTGFTYTEFVHVFPPTGSLFKLPVTILFPVRIYPLLLLGARGIFHMIFM